MAIAKFSYNATIYFSISKALVEIVYREILKSEIFNSNNISKYTTNKNSSAEGEKLIDYIYAICKKILKYFAHAQDY